LRRGGARLRRQCHVIAGQRLAEPLERLQRVGAPDPALGVAGGGGDASDQSLDPRFRHLAIDLGTDLHGLGQTPGGAQPLGAGERGINLETTVLPHARLLPPHMGTCPRP